MPINWIWFVVSPLLKILLTKFWQWVINNQKVNTIALSLKIKILIIYLIWLQQTTSKEELREKYQNNIDRDS
ncbi:MAG: hypothetical protein QNJ41_01485 [Xenococcaceae cyanobacterium MO_188.B32]|nr:hypothetical protein [Xenococcaceae cyanobacterium MO_188.B32]